MSRLYFVSALLLLCVFATTGLQAMPLHPEIVERMKREGTLAQELSYMEDMKARGINNLEGNMVYDIAPGMKIMTRRVWVAGDGDGSDIRTR